jgi:hypothetical protein
LKPRVKLKPWGVGGEERLNKETVIASARDKLRIARKPTKHHHYTELHQSY